MNEILPQSSLIKTPCPVCGGVVEIKLVDTINHWDSVEESLNESIVYKGASYLFIESVACLCRINGIPMGKEIGRLARELLVNTTETVIDIIEGEQPDFYLLEMRCSDCNMVLKRYYTPKI